ncbi:MAG: hypothetical protein ACRDRN_14680 [Sciscionella sp.]
MTSARSRVVRRLLLRGLVVAGSTVAATAAAWLISSATASADTISVVPADVTPVHHVVLDHHKLAATAHTAVDHVASSATHTATHTMAAVSAPVVTTVHDTVGVLRDPAEGWRQATDDARQAWHQVSQGLHHAAGAHQLLPIPGSGTVSEPTGSDAGATPVSHPAVSHHVVSDAGSAQLPKPAPDVQQGVEHGDVAAVQHSRHHSAPAQPRAPAPRHNDSAPCVVPGAPSSGNQAGSGSGGTYVATISGATHVPGDALSLPSRQPVRQLHGEPGRQPGSTPD